MRAGQPAAIGVPVMQYCPKCAQPTLAWGVCTNNACNYPQMKSNTQLRREQAEAERARREAARKAEAAKAAARTQARTAPAARRRGIATGVALERLCVLGAGAAGGYLGHLAMPADPAGALVGAGLGFVLGHVYRRTLKVLLVAGALAGLAYLALTAQG